MEELTIDNYRDYDLDWFFKVGDKYVHAASAGGELPEAVVLRLGQYSEIINKVSSLPVEYNPRIDQRKILAHLGLREGENQEGYNAFVLMFRGMAMKGFYSFDKLKITDPEDNHYTLVAEPERSSKCSLDFPALDELIPCIIGQDLNFNEPVDLVAFVNAHARKERDR